LSARRSGCRGEQGAFSFPRRLIGNNLPAADSIGGTSQIDLRDKALIALVLYSFARIGAVIAMKVEARRDLAHAGMPLGRRFTASVHHETTELTH
jgi:hypothetical protein